MRKRSRTGTAAAPSRCPCCYYLTLSERGGYEICDVCWWEDDGQDDDRADEVWGGPNSDLSLTQARYNFARIGACDWASLRLQKPMPLPERAIGFPFSAVERLRGLPPVKAWADPWTLSFHPLTRDVATRWKDAVRFLMNEGFSFQGTYEAKDSSDSQWTHPRFRRWIESDAVVRVEQARIGSGRTLVGAWFAKGTGLGVHLRSESVWRFGTDWNEPAVTFDMYVPEEDASESFDKVLTGWPLTMASCSRTHWGLRTLGEMMGDFGVTQFVHGKTYLASPMVKPAFVDGFRRRFGAGSVHEMSTGFVLKGAGLKAGTKPEGEAHVFVQKALRNAVLAAVSAFRRKGVEDSFQA